MIDDTHVSIPSRRLVPLEDLVSALTQARRSSGLTQDEAGARMGHTRKWVSDFEREAYTPTLNRLLRHAESLNLDVRVVLIPKKADS